MLVTQNISFQVHAWAGKLDVMLVLGGCKWIPILSGPCAHISQEIRGASWSLDKWVLDGWIVAPQLVMPRFQCHSTRVGILWGSPLLISSWDKAFYTSGRAEGYYHACKTFGCPLILLVHVKGLCISSLKASSGVRWRFFAVVMETPFHWGSDGIHLVLESLREV